MKTVTLIALASAAFTLSGCLFIPVPVPHAVRVPVPCKLEADGAPAEVHIEWHTGNCEHTAAAPRPTDK